MRKAIILMILVALLAIPAQAQEYTAPPPPDSVEDLMPVETESFAEGLWTVIKGALGTLEPDLVSAAGTCVALVAAVMLVSLIKGLPGKQEQLLELTLTLVIGAIMLRPSGSLIRLASSTVTELSEYGKLLIPVLTGALAAQGGTTSATALYAGAIGFNSLLGAAISKLLVPGVYLFLALATASAATGEAALGKIRDFLKWAATWALKGALYLFTGFMSITGVVTGTADAATVKATKMTISGMVPVVGGILSDASEAVIVGAGVMKNAVGVYGLIAIVAIWISSFLQIGVQYLMLKAASAICASFQLKRATQLIQDLSTAMGLLLGMTATVSVLLLISTVCFMKGMG